MLSGCSKEYEAWMAKASRCGMDICYAPEYIRNDKNVVLAAVRQNGKALEFASPHLQNDKEIVLAAVHQNGVALQFASPQLQNDKDIATVAARNDWSGLENASPDLKGDNVIRPERPMSQSMSVDISPEYAVTSNDGLPWGRSVSGTGGSGEIFRGYQTEEEPLFRCATFPAGTPDAYRFGMVPSEFSCLGLPANVNRTNSPFAKGSCYLPEPTTTKSVHTFKQILTAAEPKTDNTEDDMKKFVNTNTNANYGWDLEQLVFDRLDPYFPLEMIKLTIKLQQVKVTLARMQDCFQKLCIQAEMTNNPAGAKLRTMEEHIELYVVFFEHDNGDLAVDIQRRQGDYLKSNHYIRQILDAARGVPTQSPVVEGPSTVLNARRIRQFESFLDRCVSSSPAASSSGNSSPWAIQPTPEESLRSSLDNIYYSLTSNRLDQRKSGLDIMTIFTDLKKTMSYMAINIALVVVGGVSPVGEYEQKCHRIHEILVRILMKQDFVGDDTNMYSDMNRDIVPFLSSDGYADSQTLHGERPRSRYYDQYMREIRHCVLGIFANSLEVLEVFNGDEDRGSKYEMTDAVCWLKDSAEMIGEHDGLGIVEPLMELVRQVKRGPSDAYLACKVLRFLLSVDQDLRTGINKRKYHSYCQAIKKAVACGSRNAKLFSEAKKLDDMVKQR